jgi:phage gp36-like protein
MYSDLSYIKTIIPEKRLLELCDDSNVGEFVANPANDPYTVLIARISDADALIDAHLSDHYTVPVSPTPDIIRYLSGHLTVYMLFDRAHDTDMPEGLVKKREYVTKIMTQIKEGKLRIPGKQRRLDSVSSKTEDDRVFTDDLLSLM